MADVPLAAPRRATWLDRPLLPAWLRLAAASISWEIVSYTAIAIIGFALRIWDVGSRVDHHDESLHSYYSWMFFHGQGYTYDPLMHGPLQFQVVPLFYLLFGVSDFSARLLAVVLGTALLIVPYFLRRFLTVPGALAASLFLAVSPTFVYYSRFIRDDIYLAFFSLVLFVALVFYLERPRPHLLYVASAAAALGMASMEAAYLTFFIFGTFLIFQGLREAIAKKGGPVLGAIRATSIDTWLTAAAIFVAITVLLYSTFFTNPSGIWDTHHALTDPNRTDILGGILYWKLQHTVDRGGQPWFYYLLLMPLYEQIAIVFGLAGLAYAAIRRTLATTFVAWWAIMALGLYSWAGEKMPWLLMHIALPFTLLAGLAIGKVLLDRRTWLTLGAVAVALTLLFVEVHGTFLLNFKDGADPTEMMLYVQSSQDVKHVVSEIGAISHRTRLGTTMPIGLDDNDVGGWPFIWYLRNYSNVDESATFSGPACAGQYCPVLVMLGPEFDANSSTLMRHYVATRYRWNWWFPEDYKNWFPAHWSTALGGQGPFVANIVGTPTDWQHIWDWFVYRRPFGARDARWLYFLVRRDLVPGAKNFPTTPPGQPPAASVKSLAARVVNVLGTSGTGTGQLDGPRGLATSSNGTVYVADTLNHRIVAYPQQGKSFAFGSGGSAPGQFSTNDSPQSLAVAADGDVYVADTWNNRIEVFAPNGKYLRSWGGGAIGSAPGQFYGPRAVAIGKHGDVYVADTGNRRIQAFNRDGVYLFSWGSAGTAPGQFTEPSSVAINRSGDVYVSDFWNRRIQEFTASGGFIRTWPVTDWIPQAYDEPYLAVDGHGDVYATDPGQGRVLEYSSTGATIGAIGTGRLTVPIGIGVLPAGHVAVSDATANHVTIFAVPH